MILYLVFQIILSSVIALVLGLIFGQISSGVAILSLLAGFVLALKPARLFGRVHPDLRFNRFASGRRGTLEVAFTAIVLYVSFRHFMWLLYPNDHYWFTLSSFNFGDLPLHIDYIRYMASGAHFPPLNPSFASEPLRYPYGIDLYNALWEAIGVPLRSHLFVVGFVSTIASLILLRSYAGWFGIGAFFLSGGLAGWSVLQGQPLGNFQDAVQWKNLFLSVFLTQRGFLVALPLGLFLLLATRRHYSGERPLSRPQAMWIGLLWGVLPFFHLHAFVIVSIMMAAIAIETRGLKGLKSFFSSTPFYVAFVPALLFILYSTNGFRKASIAHWDFWWGAPHGHVLEFFMQNFGPWIFLPVAIVAALVYYAKRWPRPVWRERVTEFVILFGLLLLFFSYMLAPWTWDNIKVLIWPYLGLARLAYVIFDPLLMQRRRGPFLVPMFFFFLSGFVALTWSIQAPSLRGVRLYSIEDLAKAQGALTGVPVDAIFAAAPTHDHVLTYFGRARVLGYEGHLWSHGIDAKEVVEKQTQLMTGDANWLQLARELGITHIYWGPTEQMKYGVGERPWMHVLQNISPVPDHQVFVITGPLGPSEQEK